MLPKPEIDKFLVKSESNRAGPHDQTRFDSESIEAIGNRVYVTAVVMRRATSFYAGSGGVARQYCTG